MNEPILRKGFLGRSLASATTLAGVGLHGGGSSIVRLSPGSRGLRILDDGGFVEFRKCTVEPSPRCTRLVLPSGRTVDMVEHLLAAIRIEGVSDVDITVIGREVPILDGSARPWAGLMRSVGFRSVAPDSPPLVVSRPFSWSRGRSRYLARPGDFALRCTVRFPGTCVGEQSLSVDGRTIDALLDARTFVFEKDLDALRAAGLARGGSLSNAVVFGREGPLNPEGLRAPDECARHKALDFLGDMMLSGAAVIGRFEVDCPGHSANHGFRQALAASGALEDGERLQGPADASPGLQRLSAARNICSETIPLMRSA